MTLYRPLLLLCLLAAAPAFADGSTPRQAFNSINRCVQSGDVAHCRNFVTASSVDVFDRFTADNFARCLPADASYISEQTSASQSVIRASIGEGNNKRFMRVILAWEENEWKLDLPETLRRGIGERWENQLNLAEQAYLTMKNQLGIDLNCSALQNIVKAK